MPHSVWDLEGDHPAIGTLAITNHQILRIKISKGFGEELGRGATTVDGGAHTKMEVSV
jgi:hypothetical protein